MRDRLKLCPSAYPGYRSEMTQRSHIGFRRPLLHVFVLVALVCGLLLNPVLAAQCAISDAHQAISLDSAENADLARDARDDCCAATACNECCAQFTVMVSVWAVSLTGSPAMSSPASLSVGFTPSAYPVSLRPPIA